MLDKTRIKNVAKKLREVATELDALVKEGGELFAPASRETISVRKKADVGLYVEAQQVIRKWATRFEQEFKTAPYIEKSYVHMTVAVMKKVGITAMMKAVDNYFDEADRFTESQRFPFPYFIKTINKHLPEGMSNGNGQSVHTGNMGPHGAGLEHGI